MTVLLWVIGILVASAILIFIGMWIAVWTLLEQATGSHTLSKRQM